MSGFGRLPLRVNGMVNISGGAQLHCPKRGAATVICPVPLFPPNDTGVKPVTFTINSIQFDRMVACTHMGQYRVGKLRLVF